MDRDTKIALRWVGGYLIGTVLFTCVVGAFVLASWVWS